MNLNKFYQDHCVVCQEPRNDSRLTCNQKCAGKLSAAQKYLKRLRSRYSSPEKLQDLTNILDLINYCKIWQIHNPYIFELYGGGVFNKMLLDYKGYTSIKFVLSIDQDDKLRPILASQPINLKEYGKTGTYYLSSSIHDLLANVELCNSRLSQLDICYLDYCGWWNVEKYNEVKAFTNIMLRDSYKSKLLFITLNRSREHYKGESLVFAEDFDGIIDFQMSKIPGYMGRIYINKYTHLTNKMVTYGFRFNGWSRISTQKWRNGEYSA